MWIPVSTTATVYIPAIDASSVLVNAKPAQLADGLTFPGIENNKAVYEVESGSYAFVSELKK